MFAFSRASEYALLALLNMARRGASAPVSVATIAEEEALPRGYLSKIMPQLMKEGIVGSSRGTGGGFVLRCDPASITLRQVVMAIDGPLQVARCVEQDDTCSLFDRCAVTGVMRSVQHRISDVLEEFTLADALGRELPPAAPTQEPRQASTPDSAG